MSSTPSSWLSISPPGAATAPRSKTHGFHGLSRTELRRRACHMVPGFLPFLLWPIPHKDPLSPLLMQIIVGLFCLIVAGLFIAWSRIARAGVGNGDRSPAILGYAVAVLATILFVPAHLECGFAVLAVLAFGDGAATLVGKFVGGPRLPWNSQKTIAGFTGFLVVATPMTMLIYWGESNNLEQIGPMATLWQSLCVTAAGVLAGAAAESLPMRLNDNLRVGVAAAAGIIAAHAAIFGL